MDVLIAMAVDADQSVYAELNNAGKGFDPSGDIDGWRLLRAAATTDDVSVYLDEDGDHVLVGTDGTGDEDSRWAVRFPACGLDAE